MKFTIEVNCVGQLHDGLATCSYERDDGVEGLACTVNVHLGETQPSWDLQQHVNDIPVGVAYVA